jgi:hypothetical protein
MGIPRSIDGVCACARLKAFDCQKRVVVDERTSHVTGKFTSHQAVAEKQTSFRLGLGNIISRMESRKVWEGRLMLNSNDSRS